VVAKPGGDTRFDVDCVHGYLLDGGESGGVILTTV